VKGQEGCYNSGLDPHDRLSLYPFRFCFSCFANAFLDKSFNLLDTSPTSLFSLSLLRLFGPLGYIYTHSVFIIYLNIHPSI